MRDRDADPRRDPPTALFWCVALVLVGVAVALLDARGFVGVSDDDASRALIAEDFSRAPRLDPTQSSWLPLPIAIQGVVLACARHRVMALPVLSAVAIAVALAYTMLASRVGGAGKLSFGASLALLFPWVLYAAWAPGGSEALTAMFLAVAAYGLVARRWVVCATAAALACGCRYEAWMASIGFFVWAVATSPSRRVRAAVAFAPVGLVVLAWLAINRHRSGDAFDFLHSVVRYRTGIASSNHASGLVHVAAAWLALAILGAWASPAVRGTTFAAAFTLVFTLVSDRAGGGPTHHALRVLVPVIVLSAPAVACGFAFAWRRHAVLGVGALLGCALQFSFALAPMPRGAEPQTLVAALLVATSDPPGTCFALEASREDLLWIDWRSTRPHDSRPDRPFGGQAPTPDALRATTCPLVVATGFEVIGLLLADGWQPLAETDTYTLLLSPTRGSADHADR